MENVHRAKVIMALEFLVVYATSTTISNVLYSVSVGLLILFIVYEYCSGAMREIILPDKMFNISYWTFFLLVILASVLINYHDSLQFALRLTQWSVLTFVVIYIMFQWQFRTHVIISGIVAGVWTLCVFALQQFFTTPLGTRITGSFAQPNHFAMILILSIPFLVLYAAWQEREKQFRFFIEITTLIACAVLAFTGSRGGILGFCLGSFIYLLIQIVYVRKLSLHKALVACVAVALAVVCVGGNYYATFYHHQTKQQVKITRSYDNQRILFWQSSYHMWQDHKLLGVGLKHWKSEYYNHYISPKAYEKGITMPHNIFFSFFSMTGLIGGIGFLFFTFGMFFYLCRKLKQYPNDIFLNALLWSFLAIMIHGQVEVGILNRYVMILYSAYLGIGLASVAYYKRIAKH